jgi:hypothetical protein
MTTLDSNPLLRRGLAHFCSEAHERAHGHSLAHAIETKAQSVAEGLICKVNCEDGLPMDSRMLLALLSCCYARQTYRSADVAAAISNDVVFRQRCLGASPGARTIRRFRRKNRAALHACLVAGLRFLAEQKLEGGLISRICEKSLEDEARRRIIMAMFIDSMELERDQTTDIPTEMSYLFAKDGTRVH